MDARIEVTIKTLLHLRGKSKKLVIDGRVRPGGMFSGRSQSKIKGQGFNFDELRPFRFGDNPKDIDWKASSRSGKKIVKVFTQETDKPTVIICNQNKNMLFGSKEYTKSVVAAHLASLLGFHFLDRGDRVGGIVVSPEAHSVVTPKRSFQQLTRYLSLTAKASQSLLEERDNYVSAEDVALRFNRIVNDTKKLLGNSGTLVVIADIESVSAMMVEELKLLTKKHNVLFFLVYDPLEIDYSTAVDLVISDGISQVSLNTSKASMENYRAYNNKKIAHISKALNGSGLSFAMVNTLIEPYLQLSQLVSGKSG